MTTRLSTSNSFSDQQLPISTRLRPIYIAFRSSMHDDRETILQDTWHIVSERNPNRSSWSVPRPVRIVSYSLDSIVLHDAERLPHILYIERTAEDIPEGKRVVYQVYDKFRPGFLRLACSSSTTLRSMDHRLLLVRCCNNCMHFSRTWKDRSIDRGTADSWNFTVTTHRMTRMRVSMKTTDLYWTCWFIPVWG